MTLRLPLLLICTLPSLCQATTSKPYHFDLNAGLLYDDNVARATLSQDIHSDTIYNLGFSGAYSLHPSEHSLITLSAGIDSYQYRDFDKLSNTQLFIRCDYQLQPDHGFTSPWYMVSLELGTADYDSNLRDSSFASLELSAGKRFTDRISLRGGLVFENFSADADEFDADNQRLYISSDYKTSEQNIVYLTLAYTDGETATSTTDQTTASNKTTAVYQFAHHLPNEVSIGPMRMDDAFNNGFVYQLDTESVSLQLGDNFALSSQQSLDISVFYYESDSFGSSSYDGIIAQLSYMQRFE